MPFVSKKQWKWAFSNHKDFARSWADETKSFKKLPTKKRKKKKTKDDKK